MEDGSVTGLIRHLQSMVQARVEALRIIAEPLRLISALTELDAMIEMDSLKRAIVRQVRFLLVTSMKDLARKFDGHMLHTVIVGPPGVGKSKAAYCLAQIWSSLGILKDSHVKAPVPVPPQGRRSSHPEHLIKIGDAFTELMKLYRPSLTSPPSTPSKPRALFPSKSTVTALEEMWQRTAPIWDQVRDAIHSSAELVSTTTAPTPFVEMIKVCHRSDFVSGFAGQTSEKTKAFLTAHRGYCLIIEEAYCLYTGDRDGYGIEALVEINRFMDEHADEIVLIFTGYHEQLTNTIFFAQPGLRRRCLWTFEIQKYTAEGLAGIFRQQLAADKWQVADEIDLAGFFRERMSRFPAFGGDSIRLALECKMAYCDSMFRTLLHASNKPIELVIDVKSLENGYQNYLRVTWPKESPTSKGKAAAGLIR